MKLFRCKGSCRCKKGRRVRLKELSWCGGMFVTSAGGQIYGVAGDLLGLAEKKLQTMLLNFTVHYQVEKRLPYRIKGTRNNKKFPWDVLSRVGQQIEKGNLCYSAVKSISVSEHTLLPH